MERKHPTPSHDAPPKPSAKAPKRKELQLDIELLEERIAPASFSDISFTTVANKASPMLF